MSLEQFKHDMDKKGWFILEAAAPNDLVSRLKKELNEIYPLYRSIQEKNKVADLTEDTMHHTVVFSPTTLEFLDQNPAHPYLESYFEGNYILNTLGGSIVTPNSTIYTRNIHRDSRTFSSDQHILVNTLLMLDDSTIENGCTWMYSGSHKMPKKPDNEEFFSNAIRLPCKAGDLIIFDGNIWHAAGKNTSNENRNLITPIYTKPIIKQQLDYPRAFGYDFAHRISERLKQILGYNALTPTTIAECYKPNEDRFYKSDQG